jgi:hypothetical protein
VVLVHLIEDFLDPFLRSVFVLQLRLLTLVKDKRRDAFTLKNKTL